MSGVKDILDLMSGPSKEDAALVEKAYNFVAEAHKDHKRFSGEPYLVHLVETAKGLAELGMSAKTVAAGLLHDSIEDVGVSAEQIEKEFGKEILFLVEGVTKLGQFKYHGAERHRESLRKLLVATSKDARVLIIKLMDRLHNMRTLSHVPKEKQTRIALETLEIYAAIAHRLGMGLVRKELEDLAFQYAYPEDFKTAKKLLTEATSETAERLEKMSRALKAELAKNGVRGFHTDYRVKGLWSLWQKLKRKSGEMSEVYDVAALRVIVPDVADCYRALGIVHQLWRPLPTKIKDYIAFPNPTAIKGCIPQSFRATAALSRYKSAPARCTKKRSTASPLTWCIKKTPNRANKVPTQNSRAELQALTGYARSCLRFGEVVKTKRTPCSRATLPWARNHKRAMERPRRPSGSRSSRASSTTRPTLKQPYTATSSRTMSLPLPLRATWSTCHSNPAP